MSAGGAEVDGGDDAGVDASTVSDGVEVVLKGLEPVDVGVDCFGGALLQ